MKIFFIIFHLLVLMPNVSCSKSIITRSTLADTPENRRSVAHAYLQSSAFEDLYKSIVFGGMQSLPENIRADYSKTMSKLFPKEKVGKLTEDAIVKNFTVAEINAMSDFYNSPEGISITKKMGPYMADIMTEMRSAMNSPEYLEYMKSVRQKLNTPKK